MKLAIDPDSATAPFEQLRAQIIEQITAGTLISGTRLPTVRGLADELSIAPNTVLRAYRELEADGFIEGRGRLGSFVMGTADAATLQVQLAARAYADRARELGIPAAEALRLVKVALES
ncbi:GntR family transcriptional regulator [Glaciihabitans sp. dw_435]|uniref:GntR family transcriptional regulator n=1 Tax=Glaciihabitans sp. dw_435 TaxID=2720081 RepID=UPI001BD2062B|nr:GntR family transcriptional regulator [Glaciihabitans sp. dw_435]